MYMFAKHVHDLYMFFAQKKQFCAFFCAHCVNLWGMTTHVHVMYMLNNHVHALKLLTISMFMGVFADHVHVCAKF